jgi:hypothetical protein
VKGSQFAVRRLRFVGGLELAVLNGSPFAVRRSRFVGGLELAVVKGSPFAVRRLRFVRGLEFSGSERFAVRRSPFAVCSSLAVLELAVPSWPSAVRERFGVGGSQLVVCNSLVVWSRRLRTVRRSQACRSVAV